jgi:protein O-GlcNAc transferase
MSDFATGLGHYRVGRHDEAVVALEAAAGANPADPEAWHVLGLSLRALGRREDALAALNQAVRLKPTDAEALSNWALALQETGRWDEAREGYEAALALQPNRAETWNNLGVLHWTMGASGEAADAYRRALRLRPDYAQAHTNLAMALFELGEFDQARSAARTAVAFDPESASAQSNLGYVLLAEARLDEALDRFETATRLDPTDPTAASNLVFRSLGSDRLTAGDCLRLATGWGLRWEGTPRLCDRPAERIARVGFVSSDLRSHPVGFFLEPVLEHLDVETHVFDGTRNPDGQTERLRSLADAWHAIGHLGDEDAAALVETTGVDVLIDLSGHTAHNRLGVFARRPAPLQVSWLGYSGPTGLPQMDAVLLDAVLAHPGDERSYNERVVRLPDSFLCFRPPSDAPEPALPEGPPTFACFNNPAKFSRSCLEAWAEVLRRVPASTLLVKYWQSHSPAVQRRFRELFAGLGVATERIRFSPRLDRQGHFGLYNQVHVALDPFPYTGATSTLDALWMGCPVVTLAGDRYVGRMSASLLSTIGHAELVTADAREYVEACVELAQDLERLAEYRATLRTDVGGSPLCDAARFTSGFVAALGTLIDARAAKTA